MSRALHRAVESEQDPKSRQVIIVTLHGLATSESSDTAVLNGGAANAYADAGANA